MSISRAARTLLAWVALAGAGPAFAAAGSGIRLGGSDGRLHPFIDIEARYDSNAYYSADKQSAGDMIFHIRPGLQLSAPGDLAAVDATAGLDWAQYLGVDDPATRKDLSRLYGQALIGVTLNKRGAVGLELDDEFRRTPSTPAFNLPAAVISNYNALTVRAPVKPGGGALVVALVGGWTLETYEPYFQGEICNPATAATPEICSSDGVKKLGYNEFRIGADARWRFLPRTSAVFEAGWFARNPNSPTIDLPLSDGTTRQVHVEKLSGVQVQTGMTGLVTPHVGATVKAGYGGVQGSSILNDLNTFVGTVEAEWLPIEIASMRFGWVRGVGVEPGSASWVYSSTRVYGGGKYLFGGRYALRGDVAWEQRSYDLVQGSSPSANLVRVEPSVEAAFTRFLVGSIGYAYTNRDSSFPTTLSNAPGFSFSKNEAWLRLSFTY